MNFGFSQKSDFFNSFGGFCFVAEGSNLLGVGELCHAAALHKPCVSAQQINLEPRGTLLQTATLSFVLEVGGFSFPTGKGDLHERYAPVLPSLVPSRVKER